MLFVLNSFSGNRLIKTKILVRVLTVYMFRFLVLGFLTDCRVDKFPHGLRLPELECLVWISVYYYRIGFASCGIRKRENAFRVFPLAKFRIVWNSTLTKTNNISSSAEHRTRRFFAGTRAAEKSFRNTIGIWVRIIWRFTRNGIGVILCRGFSCWTCCITIYICSIPYGVRRCWAMATSFLPPFFGSCLECQWPMISSK